MGGQTALNLCIEAGEKGIWEEFNVEIIGVDIDAIQITEDREKFRFYLKKLIFLMLHLKLQHLFSKEKKLLKNLGSLFVLDHHLH